MTASPPPAQTKTMALVHLQGVKDLDLLLVEPFVLDWIEQPFSPPGFEGKSPYSHYVEQTGDTSANFFDVLSRMAKDNKKTKPKNAYPQSYEEEMPPDVAAECLKLGDEPYGIHLTLGCFTNDRALAAPGIRFTSITALIQYVQANGITVEREYSGCIY